LPTIQVKDLCVQRTTNDLVIGTFGRGIYVLDDYSPLRMMRPEFVQKDAILFPPRDAALFIPTEQFGGRGKAFLGASFYTADNPPYGAAFTYYLREAIKTRKQIRKDAEKKAEKDGTPIPYATPDDLRREAEEEAPSVSLVVSDSEGNVVRTITGPVAEGMHRVYWDLRDPGSVLPSPAQERAADDDDDGPPRGSGPLVAPGKYTVSAFKRVEGKLTPLTGPVEFNVRLDTLGNPNPDAVKEQVAFHRQVLKLQRAVTGATNVATEMSNRLEQIRKALDVAPKADEPTRTKVRLLIAVNREVLRSLRGDTVLAARNEIVPLSVADRVRYAARSAVETLSSPTSTQKDAYTIAAKEFATVLERLKQLDTVDLPALEKKLEEIGAPWTPGRLPSWTPEGK
jgi:hypothetical protein